MAITGINYSVRVLRKGIKRKPAKTNRYPNKVYMYVPFQLGFLDAKKMVREYVWDEIKSKRPGLMNLITSQINSTIPHEIDCFADALNLVAITCIAMLSNGIQDNRKLRVLHLERRRVLGDNAKPLPISIYSRPSLEEGYVFKIQYGKTYRMVERFSENIISRSVNSKNIPGYDSSQDMSVNVRLGYLTFMGNFAYSVAIHSVSIALDNINRRLPKHSGLERGLMDMEPVTNLFIKILSLFTTEDTRQFIRQSVMVALAIEQVRQEKSNLV